IGCQILHVFVHYFLVCNYLWMFCEGLFLLTILVIAFVSESTLIIWFYFIGWGVPIILTAIYAAVRATSTEAAVEYCWINDSPYLWILSGPVCLSMLLNLGFLIKIVHVLITKIRAEPRNSVDNNQIRKAVRATLILIPLLGLHYILTPFRPETKSPGEAVYETISAIVTSFQGLCVSFLFCFTNGEVHYLIKKKFAEILLNREWASVRTLKGKPSAACEDEC
ncbi:CALCRL (predicted), partial [Pycnogonum litorale]